MCSVSTYVHACTLAPSRYISFDKYPAFIDLLDDCGGFADCPDKGPASLGSGNASYTSQRAFRDFLEALARALREFWQERLHKSLRVAIAIDETSDVSNYAQHAMCYKLVLETGEAVVILAGLHRLPRTTARVLVATLKHQLKKDGIRFGPTSQSDAPRHVAMTVADTCSVMCVFYPLQVVLYV